MRLRHAGLLTSRASVPSRRRSASEVAKDPSAALKATATSTAASERSQLDVRRVCWRGPARSVSAPSRIGSVSGSSASCLDTSSNMRSTRADSRRDARKRLWHDTGRLSACEVAFASLPGHCRPAYGPAHAAGARARRSRRPRPAAGDRARSLSAVLASHVVSHRYALLLPASGASSTTESPRSLSA